jgi:plasmid stability protein
VLASFDVATLYVRNVPEDVIESLRAKAQAKGRSLNAEALEILQEAATEYATIVDRFAEIARRVNLPSGTPTPEEIIREWRDADDPRGL